MPQPAASGNRPHALDAGHAEFLQVRPDRGRAQRRPEQAGLVGRPVGHQRAGQGRIVAEADFLDAHVRRRAARPAVIAGELAERAFGKRLVRIDETFENDLGARRQRQAGDVAFEQFDRRAVDAAVIFVFAFGFRKARRRHQEQQRIDAVSGGDRHRLAHLPPLLAVERGVLAGRGIDADLARAFDHHAIGADIDAAGLRALRHHRVAGAEIKPAVERPHALRRELPDVDLVAGDDVLVADRGLGRDLLGLHGAAHLLLQRLHRLERMIHRLLADHQAEPRQVAADHVVERAMAGMALDVLEQQRRAFLAADQIGDGRRFEIGIDLGGDALELAHGVDLGQPFVEVAGVRAAHDLIGFRFTRHRLLFRGDRYAHIHGHFLTRSHCGSFCAS